MLEASEALSVQENSFALAVVEYSGNLRAAFISVFGDTVENPIASAQVLLSKPVVAERVQQLMNASNEYVLISKSAHMNELAEIRDLAKNLNQVKTALQAERSRGEVAGFYKTQIELPEGLDLELAKSAQKLKTFVGEVSKSLANVLPV